MSPGSFARRSDECAALAALSAKIGDDPLLVQGPGGNTSLKQEGTLWIKASGTCLADAWDKDIFLPVTLDAVCGAVDRDDPAAETCLQFVPPGLNPLGLRPSIETTMHAVMMHRVVVHVHCVETIAWAVRRDAAELLAARLRGMAWRFVLYVRPGLLLTRMIRRRAPPDASVLVLGNHGLVVGASTVSGAADLLAEVISRLRAFPGKVDTAPGPDLERLAALCAGTAYRPAPETAIHALATDPDSLEVARGGSLYPDHVIFLGPGIVELAPGETVAAAVARAGRPMLPLLLVPGAGALLHTCAPPAAQGLSRCLAEVMLRLSPDLPLTRLSAAQEEELVNWDAEKYRQSRASAG